MKKILTIIGARPQIIKAAALNRAIERDFSGEIKEYILHTGQHYDKNLSQVFFDELKIPKPDFQLSIGSAPHGEQTGLMMIDIEKVAKELRPDAFVLYGDTNSTLAGALVGVKMHIPVVHIEAGLRSWNKDMPEEINRIVCDHCSTLLFSPTSTGLENLKKEGFKSFKVKKFTKHQPGIYHCGDVMYDNSLYFSTLADQKVGLLKGIRDEFVLATIHRPYNTDSVKRINEVMESLLDLSEKLDKDVILPLHPRTVNFIKTNIPELEERLNETKGFHLIPPVGFLEMVLLEQRSSLVVTDSGGVQKEAYFFKKPCVIVRTETEWVELVELGCAELCFDVKNELIKKAKGLLEKENLQFPPLFGDGNASGFIISEIDKHI